MAIEMNMSLHGHRAIEFDSIYTGVGGLTHLAMVKTKTRLKKLAHGYIRSPFILK